MHIELRGINKIPYVYKTIRDKNSNVKNIYIGKLDHVMFLFRTRNRFPPTVGISYGSRNPDISISMADHSSKEALLNITRAVAESENRGRDRFKKQRNEKIMFAKYLHENGISYRRIGERLGVGKGTAHKWVHAKLTPEYYDHTQDHAAIQMEKEIKQEKKRRHRHVDGNGVIWQLDDDYNDWEVIGHENDESKWGKDGWYDWVR